MSTKPPSVPVIVLRTNPVAVCVALTSAPGTASPVASRTVPLICDVEIACAHARSREKRTEQDVIRPHLTPPRLNDFKGCRHRTPEAIRNKPDGATPASRVWC